MADSCPIMAQFDLRANMPMNTANKYFPSTWRRDAEACFGGFMTDSSVHFLAALRMLARAAGAGPFAISCVYDVYGLAFPNCSCC